MFNQLCSVVDRHYAVPKLLKQLSDAVPFSLSPDDVTDVYGDGAATAALLDEFELPRPSVAFDSRRECFVVADTFKEQRGLYGARVVIHCQAIDLAEAGLPKGVAPPVDLPRDTVIVTVAKVFAVGKTLYNRVEFSGEVGLRFVASKREGMLRDPVEMRTAENQRLEQVAPEDRWELYKFGQESVLKAAIRVVECAIHASRCEQTRELPQRAPSKRRLALWEEREWVSV